MNDTNKQIYKLYKFFNYIKERDLELKIHNIKYGHIDN